MVSKEPEKGGGGHKNTKSKTKGTKKCVDELKQYGARTGCIDEGEIRF